MNYRLLLHKSVDKFIDHCQPKYKEDIKQRFDKLKQNPYSHPELDIKSMQGYENLYRLRIGKYRFIYQVHQNELIIFMIKAGSRGDVYK